jgi:beta-1,4-mannosyl-glycoprotein beta-1,4-N-acetylglucosaminyltransferase
MIIDCVLFGEELDVLELHLSLLDEVVDRFVIVEALQTFSGLPKPLAFKENRARFGRWESKIVAVELEELPSPEPSRWLPEVVNRNGVLRGLAKIEGAPDDVVLLSDVDEIPYPASVREAAVRIRAGETSVSFELPTSRFYGNWVDPSRTVLVTKAFRRDALRSPHHQRVFEPASSTIPRAGRHISTLLNSEEVARKIQHVAHSERDNARDASVLHLDRCRRYAVEFLGGDLFQQIAADDEVLQELDRLRPDLIHTDSLPLLQVRRRYLAVTRIRRSLPPRSRSLAVLDRHAESAFVGAAAEVVAPVVLFARRVTSIPKRRRRAARRRAYLASVTCTPDNLCRVCIGEPNCL